MTFYVFGSETDVMLASDSTVYEETTPTSTSGASFDVVFCRAAVRVSLVSPYGETDPGTALTTYWIHGECQGNNGAETPFLSLYDNSGVESFRVTGRSYNAGTQLLQMYYLNTSLAWTAIGDAYEASNDVKQVYDVKVVRGASGSAELYVGGTRRSSGSASMTQFASLRKAHHRIGGVGRWSQVIIADEPTVGVKVLTCAATGDGATTAGTGSYANINEAVSNDANYNTFASNGDVRTYDISTDLTGYDVLAVGVAARVKCGATGPQNVQLCLRSAGTNYFSSTKAVNNGYSNVFASWATDPATSAAWTAANAAAINYGTKAIT